MPWPSPIFSRNLASQFPVRRADFVVAGFESGGSSSVVNYLHRIPVSRFDLFMPGPPPCDKQTGYQKPLFRMYRQFAMSGYLHHAVRAVRCSTKMLLS